MPVVVGKDTSITKRVTCRNCGAINEYVPADVRVLHSGRDYSGCMSTTKGFNCAGCAKEVITYSD